MVRTTGNNRSEAHAESALASTAEFAKTMPLTAADFSSCHPTPLTITTQVILPAPFTATIGVGSTAPGAPSCAALMVLPVDVQGDGFHLTVKVVRRP